MEYPTLECGMGLYEKAMNLYRPKWISKVFSDKERRLESAKELFQRSAVIFKLCGKYSIAEEAYLKASECSDDARDKITLLISASDVIKKENIPSAIKHMINALTMMSNNVTDFSNFARRTNQLGDLYELNNNHSEALACFQDAVRFYQIAERDVCAKDCMIKIASRYISMRRFADAFKIYEQLIELHDANTRLKFGLINVIYMSVLCAMCVVDIDAVVDLLAKYELRVVSFETSREGVFIHNIIQAFDNYDTDEFQSYVVDYDVIRKLSDSEVTLLLRIKEIIGEENGLL